MMTPGHGLVADLPRYGGESFVVASTEWRQNGTS